MKRAVLILNLLLIIAVYSFAQTPDWCWTESAGSSSSDEGRGIATDADGNIYMIGLFSDTGNFGSFTLISNGNSDIFVAKMDADGNWLWAKNVGGTSFDSGYGITTDANGNIYIIGSFIDNADFGSYSLTSNGYSDIFVAKMDADGNWLWAVNAGGYSADQGNVITTDANGNVYVTGHFSGTASFDSITLISNGRADIFIAKIDTNGNWLWAESAGSGGNNNDEGFGIITDTDDNVYIAGIYTGTAYFGNLTFITSGSFDVFVAKMDSDGNWLWVKNAGGSEMDFAYGITTDADENFYVTGHCGGTASFGSHSLASNSNDVFVAKIDADGNWLWVKNAQGNG